MMPNIMGELCLKFCDTFTQKNIFALNFFDRVGLQIYFLRAVI